MMKGTVDLRVKVILLNITAVLITLSLVSWILAKIDKTVYPDTISVAGVSLAGVDYNEAKPLLEQNAQKIWGDSILLKLPDQTVAVPFKDLGISYDYDASLRKTDSYLADGILGLFRHSIVRGKHRNITPVFNVQDEILKEGLNKFKSFYNKVPLDASIEYKNDQLTYLPHQNGYNINTSAVKEEVVLALQKGSIGPINVAVNNVPPRIKLEDITVIKDLLGVKACLLNSSADNLDKLLINIDGTILMPGEVFNLTDTAIDNSALLLTLVQNLFYKTGEEVGLISHGSGSFINKLKHPVMLSLKIEEQTLIARIFGFQSVSDKEVSYKKEITEIPPGLCVRESQDLTPGEQEIIHPGKNGIITRNYEIVTVKGKVISQELLTEQIIPPQNVLVIIGPRQK